MESFFNSNQRIFVHGGASTPNILLEKLRPVFSQHKNLEFVHLHTEGPACYAEDRYADNVRVNSLFLGSNLRNKKDRQRFDYLPCFLSEIPSLFRSGLLPIDVALIQVSPPDKNGWCSLGLSVDVARAAVESAQIVLAQINLKMPRVHGDGFVHSSEFDGFIEVDAPLFESHRTPIGPLEKAIGQWVADLVEDGSTLQFGIGAIPDAVAACLKGHRNLGVHTEMWSDGVLDLIECGAVNNSKKIKHPGKTVSSFIMGTEKVYRFVDDNPSVIQLDSSYVNNPSVILKNPKMIAVNSAVEIDLTGQICADSIGSRIISGVGGQMDFMRGATLSEGGKAIIALTSRTKKGTSRIVPTLKSGAGVVTTRAHVHYVVTEYGCVNLFGKNLSQRAKALISLAHPEDREALEEAWQKLR
jgi:4-hydroxybutyrate CoA-transferase